MSKPYMFQHFGKKAFLSHLANLKLSYGANVNSNLFSRPTAKGHIHRIGKPYLPPTPKLSPKLWHKKRRAMDNQIKELRKIQQISKRRKISMDAAREVREQQIERWS